MTHRPARLALLAALAFVFPALCPAEGSKIGFIDVQKIAKNSRSVQSSVKEAEGQLKAKQEEMEIQIKEFGKAADDLKARRSVLSPDEADKQEKKLDEMHDKLNVMQLDIEKQMRRAKSDVMGPAVDRILDAARTVAKREGFDVVLSSDIVVYGAEKSNLTALVVEELDKGAPPEKAEAPKPEEKKKDEPKPAEKDKPAPKAPEKKKGK